MTHLMSGKLEAVFRSVFNLPMGIDVASVTQADHPDWDSVAHVSLILALESEFGIQVDAADSIDITSYDAAARFLSDLGL